MTNWTILKQTAKVDKEDVEVECKEITWRPASEAELAAGSGQFKKLGIPTFRVLFKHNRSDDTEFFKVVAQYRPRKRGEQPEWRVNLHHPDEVKEKQLLTRQRTTSVSIACPTGDTVIVKSSTGTHPIESFFSRIFPENLRCVGTRYTVEKLLREAITEREAA
jgi:hypothetical protein